MDEWLLSNDQRHEKKNKVEGGGRAEPDLVTRQLWRGNLGPDLVWNMKLPKPCLKKKKKDFIFERVTLVEITDVYNTLGIILRITTC